MSKAIWFWLLFVLFVVLYIATNWDTLTWRGSLVLAEIATLIGFLGWGVYGPAVKG